jgi:sterol desaturase/sphingolipid hydroxylase (fatty acid hydroxylase superfamily)
LTFVATLVGFSGAALLIGGLVALLLRAEQLFPIESGHPRAEAVLDYKLASLNLFSQSAALLVDAAGGGLIPLRADGWWFLLSLALFILANDLFAYWVHRAQHRIPALWAIHSLHHSAEAVKLVTGARHFSSRTRCPMASTSRTHSKRWASGCRCGISTT